MKTLILCLLIQTMGEYIDGQSNVHWRRATKKEVDREIRLEYRQMARAGWLGDPPCTLGFFMGGSSGTYFLRDPCALTDGHGNFQALFTIDEGHHCEISAEDMNKQFKHDDDAIEACRQGKLPEKWNEIRPVR